MSQRATRDQRNHELDKLQGTWRRGESGCSIRIEGPNLHEMCGLGGTPIYGDKWYVVSFPHIGPWTAVGFEAVVDRSGATERFELERVGNAVVSEPVRRGRLQP